MLKTSLLDKINYPADLRKLRKGEGDCDRHRDCAGR